MRRALRALGIQKPRRGSAMKAREEAGQKARHEWDDESDANDVEDDECPSELPVPSDKRMNRARHSVSAEVYGQWNKRREFTAPKHPKTPEQEKRIRETCLNSFMFKHLEEDDLATVILAFVEVRKDPGEAFITQGDDGDCLYLIEDGKVKVTKTINDEEVFLCHMMPGDAVGELALLYNAPRAATCKAEEPLTLWRLDRESFNHIVKDAAQRRRELYESFLKEVPLLDSMDPYERCKLCDALRTTEFTSGMDIIRQGEEGNSFFIIESGQAEAVKDGVVVMEYKRGDYFGELALLRNQPRAASVRAIDRVKVISLDRPSFQRLLGPLEDLLKRKAGRYEEIEAEFRRKHEQKQ